MLLIKIPPETKDALVAWYSPYCKQRMTNYDVIESYADDFTKWRIENTDVTSTQKKIVNVFYTYNKGYKNPIVLPELISIQSSDDYNGVRINSSNGVQAGNKLFIGSVGENDNTHVVADFYQLLLFDRVLTDEEREWVKENLIEPDTVSAAKACTALFEPENLEELDGFPNGIVRDSLGGKYYLLPHSKDYTIQDGIMKSTDDTFLITIEKANPKLTYVEFCKTINNE